MDLVLPLGLSGQLGGGGGVREPWRGAATFLGFQTQGSGMVGVESHDTRLPAPSFITHTN